MTLTAARCLLPALVAGSLLLTGCSALGGESSTDGGDQVTAAFYPLEYAAKRVAGEHFDVEGLTSPGQEPHDLELSVKKTAQVAEARLVVFESGFQPAVDEAVEQSAQGETLDAASAVDLLPYGEEGHEHESHEGHDHAEGEGHAEDHEGHDHEHGEFDPHFWLDPLLMADFSDEIAARLSEIDPDHADDFEANAAEFRTELEQLDRAYADGLAQCERDLVVVNHDAFGYLTRYGLHFEAITGLSPGAEPTVGNLSRLQDLARREGLTTVFSETLLSKKTAGSLASDLGIEAEVLDPIEGLSDLTADEDYVSLMRSNLTALQKANGC